MRAVTMVNLRFDSSLFLALELRSNDSLEVGLETLEVLVFSLLRDIKPDAPTGLDYLQ